MVTGEGLGSLHPCNELVGVTLLVGDLPRHWYDSQSKDIQRRCTRTIHRNATDELEDRSNTGREGGSRTGRED